MLYKCYLKIVIIFIIITTMKINFDELEDTLNTSQEENILNRTRTHHLKPSKNFQIPTQKYVEFDGDRNVDYQIQLDAELEKTQLGGMDESVVSFVKRQLERDAVLEQHQQNDTKLIKIQTEAVTKVHGMKQLKNSRVDENIYDWYDNSKKRGQHDIKKQLLRQNLQKKLNNKPHRHPNKEQKKSMQWVYGYKKHNCGNKVSSEIRKVAKDIFQVTHQPRLYPNKYNKKKTVNSLLSKNYTVYDKLYKEANKRQMKKIMKIEIQENQLQQTSKPTIHNDYFEENGKCYIPLKQRLDDILCSKYKKREQHIGIDENTGKKMFEPNLSHSRQSYRMFFQSLSKEKLDPKKYQKTNKIKIQNEDRKMKKTYNGSLDLKTVESITEFFYSESHQGLQMSGLDNQSSHHSSHHLDLWKSTSLTGFRTIKKEQFNVLQSFLHDIQAVQNKSMEVQTNLSSTNIRSLLTSSKDSSSRINANLRIMDKNQFKQRLSEFYQKLTLYDKQILRDEVRKRNKQINKLYEHEPFKKNIATHRPSINIRSSSLESVSKRYDDQLYYI